MEIDRRHPCAVGKAADSTRKGEGGATGTGGTSDGLVKWQKGASVECNDDRLASGDGVTIETTTERDKQCPCPAGKAGGNAMKCEGVGTGIGVSATGDGQKEPPAECNDTRANASPCAATADSSHPLIVSIATPPTLLLTTAVSPPGAATSRVASSVSRSPSSLSPGRSLPSPLHTVVYYQNRFVTINGATDCPVTAAPNIRLSTRSPSSLPAMNAIELDLMDPAGRKPTHGQSAAKFGQSVLSKLTRLLQDNRMASGDTETKPNKEQGQSNPVLRKILNIIFLSTGIILLLAVVGVIIYTYLGVFSDSMDKIPQQSGGYVVHKP